MADSEAMRRVGADVMITVVTRVRVADGMSIAMRVTIMARRTKDVERGRLEPLLQQLAEEAVERVCGRYSPLDIRDAEKRGMLSAELGEELARRVDEVGAPVKILMVRVDEGV